MLQKCPLCDGIIIPTNTPSLPSKEEIKTVIHDNFYHSTLWADKLATAILELFNSKRSK